MNQMKIAWIDDDIQKLDMAVKTLELLDCTIETFRTVVEFLDWLQNANDNSVNVFIVDLRIKAGDRRLSEISNQHPEIHDNVDTGILIVWAIREKFKTKPIIVLTIVQNYPYWLFDKDKMIIFINKQPEIKPVYDLAKRLLETK